MYQLPVLERQLALGVEVSFAQPGRPGSGTSPVAGDYSYQLTQRLVMVSLDALYFLPLGTLTPYGGLGWGVYLLRTQMDSFEQTTVENQLRSGLQLRGGLGLAVGPGDVFAEVRYHYTGLEFLTTGVANAGGFTGALGYRLRF
jgi:hypothetical protein